MNTDKWHLYNTGNHISDVYSQPSSLLLSKHFMQNKYNILKVLSHTFENHRKPKVLIKIPVNFPDNMYVSDISLRNVICIFLKICSLWHIKRIWQNSKISMLCGKSNTTLCTVDKNVRCKNQVSSSSDQRCLHFIIADRPASSSAWYTQKG